MRFCLILSNAVAKVLQGLLAVKALNNENGYSLLLLQAVSTGAPSPNLKLFLVVPILKFWDRPQSLGLNRLPFSSTGIVLSKLGLTYFLSTLKFGCLTIPADKSCHNGKLFLV